MRTRQGRDDKHKILRRQRLLSISLFLTIAMLITRIRVVSCDIFVAIGMRE